MNLKEKFLKRKEAQLAAGMISRSSFITSAIATGVAIPAALGWADAVAAATPTKGGLLRLGVGS